MKLFKTIFKILASYGLAATIFVLMLILVLFGTLEQVDQGIYDVQNKYFTSSFVIHDLFNKVPIPLPGGLLLMSLLGVNLLCGGFIRIKKDWRRAGILVIHFGIMFMLCGNLLEYAVAEDGHMSLFPGDESSEFESYHLWEIAITEANAEGEVTEFIIPHENFFSMGEADERTFTSAKLPFDLTVSHVMENCTPMQKGPMFEVDVPIVEGLFLQKNPRDPQNERNMAGLYVTVHDKQTGDDQQDLLFGTSWGMGTRSLLTVNVDDKDWVINLRKERYSVPFSIQLHEFTPTFYPGTQMPEKFESEVTKVYQGAEQRATISMNAPMRHGQYTLYQASYGKFVQDESAPYYSALAVWYNPADQFPLYACIIICIGLTLHFSLKLTNYLRAESRRAAR
jgi:hypothetical protein